MSIVDFLFIFLIISLFMNLSGGFWLSFVTWVYYCFIFFVIFSSHSLKNKFGYGLSYATNHEAHWFQHEMGSHILSLLFACLSSWTYFVWGRSSLYLVSQSLSLFLGYIFGVCSECLVYALVCLRKEAACFNLLLKICKSRRIICILQGSCYVFAVLFGA